MDEERIESRRQNIVVLPAINKGPDARAAGKKFHPMTSIPPANFNDAGQFVSPGVKVLPKFYLDQLLDEKDGNEQVKALFSNDGGLKRLAPQDNAEAGTPQSLMSMSEQAAYIHINDCQDRQQLITWLSDAAGNVRDAALARLDVLEKRAGNQPTLPLDGVSQSADDSNKGRKGRQSAA